MIFQITDRIDAITQIPPERHNLILPAPKSVKIELTGRCNYRCGFCALPTREKQPTKDMDWGFFTRIAREMRDAGVEELGVFLLGESFMAPDLLVRAIAYAKEIGFPYVFLTSNGSLATPERVRACIEAGLDSLKWSLNHVDEKQFRQVTGVRGALWHKAKENMRAAKSIRDKIEQRTGHHCGLFASSIKYDDKQQDRLEALVTEMLPYIDQHYWLPLYSMGDLATKREQELGWRPTAGNQGRLGALRDPLPCWAVFTEGHITVSSFLSACYFDPHDHWFMADLNKVSFMEGWNCQAFQNLRQAHLSKDIRNTACEGCVLYHGGDIRPVNLFKSSDIQAPLTR